MSTMTHTKHRKRRKRFGATEMKKLYPALIEGRMARASVPLWGGMTRARQEFLRTVFGDDAARYVALQSRVVSFQSPSSEPATAEQVREYIRTETRPAGSYTPPDGYVVKNGMRLLELDSGTAVFYAPFGAAPHERNY